MIGRYVMPATLRVSTRDRVSSGVLLAENDCLAAESQTSRPVERHWLVCFAAAAFNLRRLITLIAAPA
jgi:hypothetical protein